jgi:predicted dehydrogenase
VYVEEPVSHSIWEGGKIIEAAKKYSRIVQAGTQYRSDEGLKEAAAYIHQGNLGKVLWGHVLWYELRGSIGKVAPYTPDGLDYDLYCGPVPVEPLTREKLHYDWHWVWSTGTGDLGNSGIHAFDVCRWFAGYNDLPPRVLCTGGRFGVDDAGQTPNTQFTILAYEPAPIYIENRNLPMSRGMKEMNQLAGIREGLILRCENGYFAGLRGGGWAYDNDGKKIRQFKGDGGAQHAANFIQAIDAFTRALETIIRLKQHLLANEVDLQKTPVSLGPWLTIDPFSRKGPRIKLRYYQASRSICASVSSSTLVTARTVLTRRPRIRTF